MKSDFAFGRTLDKAHDYESLKKHGKIAEQAKLITSEEAQKQYEKRQLERKSEIEEEKRKREEREQVRLAKIEALKKELSAYQCSKIEQNSYKPQISKLYQQLCEKFESLKQGIDMHITLNDIFNKVSLAGAHNDKGKVTDGGDKTDANETDKKNDDKDDATKDVNGAVVTNGGTIGGTNEKKENGKGRKKPPLHHASEEVIARFGESLTSPRTNKNDPNKEDKNGTAGGEASNGKKDDKQENGENETKADDKNDVTVSNEQKTDENKENEKENKEEDMILDDTKLLQLEQRLQVLCQRRETWRKYDSQANSLFKFVVSPSLLEISTIEKLNQYKNKIWILRDSNFIQTAKTIDYENTQDMGRLKMGHLEMLAGRELTVDEIESIRSVFFSIYNIDGPQYNYSSEYMLGSILVEMVCYEMNRKLIDVYRKELYRRAKHPTLSHKFNQRLIEWLKTNEQSMISKYETDLLNANNNTSAGTVYNEGHMWSHDESEKPKNYDLKEKGIKEYLENNPPSDHVCTIYHTCVFVYCCAFFF